MVNPGHEFGYHPFPEAQMSSLIALAKAILSRHHIPPWRVLGHSDVAPARKQDPGELFDWARLAAAGIGLWPEQAVTVDETPDEAALLRQLAAFGYDVEGVPSAQVIAAFQRHFRPERVDGRIDRQTAGRLTALLRCLDARRRAP